MRSSFASASSRIAATCAASSGSMSSWPFGGFRNQYASTGTIVSAPSSEDSIAMPTVRAKGRNSSPAMPETTAIGRNTTTVARVEAVIAPATSPTASRIARRLVLP